jgi:AI-2 transport protein TqsA
VVILLALVFSIGILLLLMYSAAQIVTTLPETETPILQQVKAMDAFFANYNIDSSATTVNVQKLALTGISKVSSSLTNISALLATFGLAILASAFMLLESDNFSSQLGRKFGSDSPIATSFTRFMQETQDFIRVTTVLGLLQGTLAAIALALIGVPLPIVWGVLFWLLNYIPYLGFWLALLPPFILAGLTLGWQYALLVLIIYMIISNVFKLLVLPKVMGDKVDTSMTVGFLGLFFWGWVFGILGMLLAYPYTLLVRDVALASTNEFWLVDLMRKGSPPSQGQAG